MRLLLCVVLFVVATVRAQREDFDLPDDWQNDYSSLYDNYKDIEDSDESVNLEQAQTSKPIDQPEIETQNKDEDKESDVLADYQIEDNRSSSDEKEQASAGQSNEVLAAEAIPDAKESDNNKEWSVLPLEEPQKNDPNDQSNEENKVSSLNDNDMWSDKIEDKVDPLPTPSTDHYEDILEETKDILSKDTQGFYEQQEKESVADVIPEYFDDDSSEIDQIIAETNKLLRDSNDNFRAEDYDVQEREKSDEKPFSTDNDEVEEDTPEKVYTDLNADLDKLFETIDKLSKDDSEEVKKADEGETDGDDSYEHNVQDYEEKYGRPYNEDVALSWRNAEDLDLEANDSNQYDDSADEDDTNVVLDRDGDDYENLDDSNLSEIFKDISSDNQNESSKDEQKTEQLINENSTEQNLPNDKNETTDAPIKKDNSKEIFETNSDDELESLLQQMFLDDIKKSQSYGNDALVDENQPQNEDAAEFESIEANDTKIEENIEQKSIMVDELSSAELSDLMTQFAIAHSEDLDVHSKSFAGRVTPIHVSLSVDEPTVITSPNYPEPYPTNNIVDWIFEGPGTGIELNITDFAVNGAIGDYLLVKPGGIDESGNDGLIFSYRLNSERRYRFTDVNRMFVRFEAKPGWQFMNGFSFSVKMIWPLSNSAVELELPESEAVVRPPQETLTLNLAGLTVSQFTDIKAQFLELIADMASVYIKDNNIIQGFNTTSEVTQITRTAICNIRWPDYETCVEITFGVPLQYEDDEEPRLNAEDLSAMWTGYIIKEHFAERLRLLGITEYAIPNDRTVLMVWLVIAAGVLISMAMLAFALWRFSCLEDYTRMQAYSDTDSLKNEKRNLDLYPTPHQTLPPLYTENDYKWADDKYDDSTRVDMGGFANKSYVRDELFDLDSDEDVITTRDRKGVISPREIYDV